MVAPWARRRFMNRRELAVEIRLAGASPVERPASVGGAADHCFLARAGDDLNAEVTGVFCQTEVSVYLQERAHQLPAGQPITRFGKGGAGDSVSFAAEIFKLAHGW